VSWLFSFLLGCYVLVRIVLRVRGQLRWLSVRDDLPTPPPRARAPEHLAPQLAGVFEQARDLRVELVEARRVLMTISVTDPDAALGRVRDARYRRALMQSWTQINAWIRGIRELDPASAAVLADLHLGVEPIERLRDSLRGKWRAVSRARALDLFELTDVRAVERTLARLEDELEAIERGLARLGDDPYRDRLVDLAPAC
jgi:hypothetical protein